MKRGKGLLALLLLVACVGLGACGRTRRSAGEILEELNALCEALPAGVCYRSGAEEGDGAYLAPSVRESLYGAEAAEIFGVVEEYAIYLSSFAMPYEVAVFRCYSATDAHRVAALCLGRADALRVALNGTPWEGHAEGAQVIARGRYVVMAMTEEPSALRQEALRLMR